MSNVQFFILVLVLALSVAITRFVPFLVFGGKKTQPAIIDYLGKVLPAAMMGFLVVYCFKDIDFRDAGELVPAVIASLTVAGIHLWKRNTILSIAIGTAIYMVLIRVM